MSIFDQKPGSGPSAEAELASLQAEAARQLDTPPSPDVTQGSPAAPAADDAATSPAPGEDGDGAYGESAYGDDGRQVPLKVLMEERSRRRALESRLAAFNDHLEAMAQQQQAAPSPQPQPEGPPDPDVDPIGALRYERQQREHLQRYLQGQALEQRVTHDYVADAQRFAAETPDFGQAYNHLFAGRIGELRAQGWSDDSIRQQVRHEEFTIALAALRAGRSPAQTAYELAKTRGYVPVATRPSSGSGAADPTMAALKARAAASISEGGTPSRADLSLDDIGRLNGPAFDTAFDRYTRAQGKRSSLFRNG
jgi:hypothetical protein